METNLRVELIDCFNGILYTAEMDVMLYSVPKKHRVLLFRRAKISLLGESLSSSRVAFRSKIIEYQNIKITIVTNISIL